MKITTTYVIDVLTRFDYDADVFYTAFDSVDTDQTPVSFHRPIHRQVLIANPS